MPETPQERHNRLAPMLVALILTETKMNETEAVIIAESVVYGVLSHFRGNDVRAAAEFLDSMTDQIIERMKQ